MWLRTYKSDITWLSVLSDSELTKKPTSEARVILSEVSSFPLAKFTTYRCRDCGARSATQR